MTLEPTVDVLSASKVVHTEMAMMTMIMLGVLVD
jgi:hypothetical protein